MRHTFVLQLLMILIVGITCCTTSYAQYRYKIGVEGGSTSNYYRIKDAGNNLKNSKAHSAIAGINFRINGKKNFYYEAALLAMEYTLGLGLKQQTGYTITNADEVIMLPLRVGYNVKINSKFSFSPVVGTAIVLKTLNDDGLISLNDPMLPNFLPSLVYTIRPSVKNFFILGQLGAALNYHIAKRTRLSLGVNYYQGVINHSVYDVEYTLDNSGPRKAVVEARGTFINYSLGFRYAFSPVRL